MPFARDTERYDFAVTFMPGHKNACYRIDQPMLRRSVLASFGFPFLPSYRHRFLGECFRGTEEKNREQEWSHKYQKYRFDA